MKSSVASSGLSAQKVVAQIRKVRKAAEKASESDRRFADYRYLRAVLHAYRYFEGNDLLPHLLETAPSLLMTPVRADWHPLRVIIEATCLQPDLRMRSRWTRALAHVLAEDIDPQELSRFIRANNGIAGCADLASKTRRRITR
ncbi:hypothetical protein [Bradyrhizobium sp. ERR14]|uniref:hypothetical protein n=1 Tax=Bradyrhizobium sp. ERR14 TaxID=2663837 RepID=UPI00161FD460|nr:hypothetical protein [Bradyrhizobium sp. ERR14]MBB4397187.1 hypothetical protein [Bradyrhizobium sp. ERR14]